MKRHTTRQQRSRVWIVTLTAVIFGLLLLVNSAEAQQKWKYVYGVDSTSEEGHNRVIPVNLDCADGGSAGYIAVGNSTVGGHPHVYVVRTNNNGARLWEKVYDINDDSLPDEGWAIVELADGSGFAVTGHTFSEARAEDVFIMKIDCSGNVGWTTTYGTASHEYAYDIIQAEYGNPVVMPPDVPTNQGDLVVCGRVEYESQGTFRMDGYLLRVTSAGTLIWNRRYDMTPTLTPDYRDWLWGLTEAVPTGGASAGDIIAVGQSLIEQTFGKQGLILRVDGHDGTTGNTTRQRAGLFGAALQWNCPGPDSGDSFHGDEVFYSVVEMSDSGEMDPNMVFNVAVAGSSNAASTEEIFVVKLLGGDPCSVAEQRLIGDKAYGNDCGFNDVATCIREVEWEMSGTAVSQYDLALTGFTDNTVNSDLDMFLLTISPVNINPITGGIKILYGSTSSSATLNEAGRSLHPIDTLHSRTEGFILCGTNFADPVGTSDPSDLYLVKTDNAGNASPDCENTYGPIEDTVDWDVCVTPSSATYGDDTTVTTSTVTTDTDDEICTGALKPSIQNKDNAETSGDALSFRFSPNPVQSGERLTIRQFRGVQGDVRVYLYDVSGRYLRTLLPNTSAGEFALETHGLAAGTYTITVEDSRSTGTIQFTVVR